MAKFPLHRRRFQRRGQSQTEPLEQDLLVLGGLADAALSDHHAGSGRQRHVDQGGLGQGLENLPRLVAQSGLAAAGGQGRRLVLLLLKLSQGVFRRPNEVAPPTFPQELAQQFQSQPGAAELTAASYTNPLHIDFHPAGQCLQTGRPAATSLARHSVSLPAGPVPSLRPGRLPRKVAQSLQLPKLD